jgi:hypothetical protein
MLVGRSLIMQSSIKITGINATSQTFYIDEFQRYSKQHKSLKRFNDLCYKKSMGISRK